VPVDAEPRTWERHHVRLTLTTAVIVVATLALSVIARDVFNAAHRVLGWAAAAIVVAALLELPIDILARRVGRIAAVAIVFLAAAGIVCGLVYGAFDELRAEVARFAEAAPEAAANLEARDDQIGEAARDIGATDRVDDFVEELEARFGRGGQGVLIASAGSLPTYFVCAILTIFLMSYGPRIVMGGLAQIQDEGRRVAVADILGRALVRSRSAIFVQMAEALLVAGIVWLLSVALDLPAPILVALLAGLLALLPAVGLILASLLVALLTAGFVSVTAAGFVLAGAVVVQYLEARWVRRGIERSTMRIGPAVPWLVAVIGYSVYGVGGALYGAAYAVFGLAVMDAIAVHRRAAAIPDAAVSETVS
jgi:predicted PurR-regulated permease PerM